jgi:hypothetical protein
MRLEGILGSFEILHNDVRSWLCKDREWDGIIFMGIVAHHGIFWATQSLLNREWISHSAIRNPSTSPHQKTRAPLNQIHSKALVF